MNPIKKISSILILISSLVILGFVTGCDKTPDSKTKESQKATSSKAREKVTIAQFGHIFVYMPLYVAQQKGYFREEGFDVTFVNTGGDEKTFAALVSGSAQFGVSDPIFTAIARQRGQGGKVIASIVNGIPLWGVTRKDIQSITDPSMFSGLRVASYPAPSTTYTLVKDAIDKGAETKSPPGKVVQGAFGTLLSMLESDAADVAVVIEPAVSTGVSRGMKVVYSLPEVHGDFAFTGLMVTDEYLVNNGDTAQRMVNSLVKATRFIRTDIEGTAIIAANEFPELSGDVIREALARMVESNTVPVSMQMSEKAWAQAIALRVRAGDLAEATPMSTNIDNSFVAKAEAGMGSR